MERSGEALLESEETPAVVKRKLYLAFSHDYWHAREQYPVYDGEVGDENPRALGSTMSHQRLRWNSLRCRFSNGSSDTIRLGRENG